MEPIIKGTWQNIPIYEELERRGNAGISYGTSSEFSKMKIEIEKVYAERTAREVKIWEKFAGMLYDDKRIKNPTDIWDPREYSNAVRDSNTAARNRVDQIHKGKMIDPTIKQYLSEKRKEPNEIEDPVAWLQHKYLMAIEDSLVADQIDYNKFNKLWDPLENKYKDRDDGVLERFNLWRYPKGRHHPFADKRYEMMKILEDSGYWKDHFPNAMNSIQNRSMYKNRGIDVFKIWEDYQQANTPSRQAMKRSIIQGRILKEIEKVRDHHRLSIRRANPSLDAILVFWFKMIPARMENLNYYNKLYKKVPPETKLAK